MLALSSKTSVVSTKILSAGIPNYTGFPIRAHDGISLRTANANAYKSVFVFNPNHHPYFSPHVCFQRLCFRNYRKHRVIIPCEDSSVQTPIFPVKKVRPAGQLDEWRFVQDLQAVNAAVYAPAPNVPNPYTIISQVPEGSKFFSVVDLSNAFFSVPVHKNSQFLHILTPQGKSFSPTRISAIVNTPKPITKKQSMSFLGMCSYCRTPHSLIFLM